MEADGTLKGVLEESLMKKQFGGMGRVREPGREEETPEGSFYHSAPGGASRGRVFSNPGTGRGTPRQELRHR